MIESFCKGLHDKITRCRVDVAHTITSGQCRTFEQYRFMVGKLEGLAQAEDCISEIFKGMYDIKHLE